MNLFSEYRNRVIGVVEELASNGELPHDLDTSRISVEPPREASHGDLATNAAMVLAKQADMKPRDLAEMLSLTYSSIWNFLRRNCRSGFHKHVARLGGLVCGASRNTVAKQAFGASDMERGARSMSSMFC